MVYMLRRSKSGRVGFYHTTRTLAVVAPSFLVVEAGLTRDVQRDAPSSHTTDPSGLRIVSNVSTPWELVAPWLRLNLMPRLRVLLVVAPWLRVLLLQPALQRLLRQPLPSLGQSILRPAPSAF